MKKISLYAIFVLMFFLVGCGGSGDNGYDTDNETHDTDKSGDSDNVKPDGDTDGTSGDSDTETPDDGDVTDSGEGNDSGENDDSDSGDTADSGDFWSTCEGIVACSTGCLDDDFECVNNCYSKGGPDGQLNYRRWRECFDEKCAEDRTAECSASQCAEYDEICNIAEAFEYEYSIPAPYGNAEFAGDFSFILSKSAPTNDKEVVMQSFVSGTLSTTSINPGGTIISFVRTVEDPDLGNMVEVYQVPYNTSSRTPGNPAVVLRIKSDAAVEGEHTVGVGEEREAELIVVDIDSSYNIACHHAFGIGSFKIEEAVIKTGTAGRLKFSAGAAELFYPENIPALGGDATEILGVTPCSLIY